MLSLRRSLFDRLLHLPLPKLWDMKTGGILSRLTGDVETTTGLLQMAVVSPSVSLVRLVIAVTVLMLLNWRLALTALAIIPGVMTISFAFSRAHPADLPIGPQGRRARSTAASARRSPASASSAPSRARLRELRDYMLGRHDGPAQGALRAPPRAGRLDVLGPAARRRQRRDRLVRRLPERRRAARRSATSWRSSGTRSC